MNQQETDDINVDGIDSMVRHLHESTYGINSDPLTAFAITFSALIHDVDHQGVSNMQLVVEDPEMATKYRNKCIAEQNSLDVGTLLEGHILYAAAC